MELLLLVEVPVVCQLVSRSPSVVALVGPKLLSVEAMLPSLVRVVVASMERWILGVPAKLARV